MKKQINPAKSITGANIYHIKNQTIYYSKFDKTAYIITNSNAQDFSNWQLRGPLSVMLSCLLIILNVNILLSISLGILAYAISTIVFTVKYLPNLAVSTNFEKPKSEGFFKNIANRNTEKSIKIMLIMFIVIAIIMFIIGEVINKYEGSVRILNIVIICISLVCAGGMGYVLKLIKDTN